METNAQSVAHNHNLTAMSVLDFRVAAGRRLERARHRLVFAELYFTFSSFGRQLASFTILLLPYY